MMKVNLYFYTFFWFLRICNKNETLFNIYYLCTRITLLFTILKTNKAIFINL